MKKKTLPTSAVLIQRICRRCNIPYGEKRDGKPGRFTHLQLLKLWALISTQEEK